MAKRRRRISVASAAEGGEDNNMALEGENESENENWRRCAAWRHQKRSESAYRVNMHAAVAASAAKQWHRNEAYQVAAKIGSMAAAAMAQRK